MSSNNIEKIINKFVNQVCELANKDSICYTKENINMYVNDLLHDLKDFINFDAISIAQLNALGCNKVTTGGSVNGMEIFLLPSWLLPILPIGLKVYEYHDGREIIYDGSNIGNEFNDNGYLDVGLIPNNKK